VEIYREEFRPGFERFRAAAPAGAKHHITDAFKKGNEAWGSVAQQVRNEFLSMFKEREILVVYHASRLVLERKMHLRIKSAVRSGARENRVETSLFARMALKLDAFAEEFGRRRVDLYFDRIDQRLTDLYRSEIERAHSDRHEDGIIRMFFRREIEHARSVSYQEGITKAWDPETRKKAAAKLPIDVGGGIPLVSFLGDLKIAGRNDPLLLVTDIVANSLLYHLRTLATELHLNRPSSIEAWSLAGWVYGVRERAI
jgi:hypothetical protein